MGTLWNYLFGPDEEEKKEENTDNSSGEKKEENTDNNSEEKKEENTDNNSEEKKEEPKEQEPLVFRIYHKLMANKLFTDCMLFFSLILVGIFFILSYGEIKQNEGCVSFESCLEQWKAKNIGNAFAKGDMDAVLSYLQIEKPFEDYTQDTQHSLEKDISEELSQEFHKLFPKNKLKPANIKCEYEKIDKKNTTRLVSTIRFQLSQSKSFLFILERYKNNAYYMHLENEKGFKEATFSKINALFHYVSTSYEDEADYKLCSLLIKNNPQAFKQASAYFYEDAGTYDSNEHYATSISGSLCALDDLNLTVTEAILSPYTYNPQKSEKRTRLFLRITNTDTNQVLLYEQPLIVGLYGYQPDGDGVLYGTELSHEVTNSITRIFK